MQNTPSTKARFPKSEAAQGIQEGPPNAPHEVYPSLRETPTKEDSSPGSVGYIVRDLNFADFTLGTVDYPEKSFVFTSIPTFSELSATPSSPPDERSECILRGAVSKQSLFSTQGYPSTIPKPARICHLVKATTTMGLGMFANCDIKMGDLIIAERPLMVTPGAVDLNIRYVGTASNEQKRRVVLLEWEKVLNMCFQRLSEQNKDAFLKLANINNDDDSGAILGVIKTNGFVVTLGEGFFKDYSAVCKELSRVNHSCIPNAAVKFSLSSFSFQLRATSEIRKDEQIFISYCSINLPSAQRQEKLAAYGFQCTCPACTSSTSDHLRLKILSSIDQLSDAYSSWIRNPSLPDNHVIKPSLLWLSIIEKEGMSSSHVYEHHLQAVMRAYSALGDMNNTLKYAKISAHWNLAVMGNADLGKDLLNPVLHRGSPYWRARSPGNLVSRP